MHGETIMNKSENKHGWVVAYVVLAAVCVIGLFAAVSHFSGHGPSEPQNYVFLR